MGNRIDTFKKLLHSERGKNAMTFMVFLCISAILWIVQVLNEETQRDLRCSVSITNVPDSLTRVSPMPEALNVSVRAKGTQLIRYMWDEDPHMNIDFRLYKSGNKIQFSEASLKAFFRSMVGSGCIIQSVTPDSLSIAYTSQPGIKMPVSLDIKALPAPQHIVIGKPKLLSDSVVLYYLGSAADNIKSLPTSRLVLNDMRKSEVVRVPVVTPPNCRAIPDSVDVSIEVEPLVSKMRRVEITPLNVPEGSKLILVPSQVEVYYMVPMSTYKKSEGDPKFVVTADYGEVNGTASEKIAVNLKFAPKDFRDVFLSADSVDYILEQK